MLADRAERVAERVRESCARIALDSKAVHLMMHVGYGTQGDLLDDATIVEHLRDWARALHAGDLHAAVLFSKIKGKIIARGPLHPMASLIE
jgi:hypothetical protein